MQAHTRELRMSLRPATAPAQLPLISTVLHAETSPQPPRDEETPDDSNASSMFEVVQDSEPAVSEDDDEEWKLWYRNLKYWNFDSKSFTPSRSVEKARRDSVIEPKKHPNPTANENGVINPTEGSATAPSSSAALFPPPTPRRPLQILSQLRTDVVMPAPVRPIKASRSTVDARQPGTLAAELEALRNIVTSSLERQSKIPLAVQSSLISRLERVSGLIEKRRYWDRSQLMLELDQQAGSLATSFVQLINPPRTCIVCGADNPTSAYRSKITTDCTHVTNTCNTCLQTWIAQQLADKGWDKIKCAECPQLFAHSDVRSSATLEVFERYDELATRSVLQVTKEFRWCLNPNCKAGQIHTGGARFECSACSYRFCIKHSSAWHQNETCEEYDRRQESAKVHDEACEEWKAAQTKVCSECSVVIEKNGGCDHMTCAKCYASFSWEEAPAYVTQEFEPPEANTSLAGTGSGIESSRKKRVWTAIKKAVFSRAHKEEVVMDVC